MNNIIKTKNYTPEQVKKAYNRRSRLYNKYKDIVDIDNINYIHSTIPHPTMESSEIEDLVHSFNVGFNKGWKYKHPLKFMYKYIWIPFRKGFNKPLQRI